MTRPRCKVHLSTTRPALASFFVAIAPSGVLAQSHVPTHAPLRSATASQRCNPIKHRGRFTEYALASSDRANNFAAGVDGNVWFDASDGFDAGALSKITPAGRVTSLRGQNSTFHSAYNVTAGPDGNMWFLERKTFPDGSYADGVAKISPAGHVTDYLGDLSGQSGGMTTGPDGNIWYTLALRDQLGRISPQGVTTVFTLPGPSGYIAAYGIAVGPDGNLWIADNGQGFANTGKIDRINPKTGRFLPSFNVASPYQIVMGPDRNMYFTGSPHGGVGRITQTGIVTYFPGASESGITAGSDGNIWMADYSNNSLDRFNPKTATFLPPLYPSPFSDLSNITSEPMETFGLPRMDRPVMVTVLRWVCTDCIKQSSAGCRLIGEKCC